MKEKLIEKLKAERTASRVFALVFLGGALNAIFLGLSFWQFVQSGIQIVSFATGPTLVLIGLYLALAVFYGIATSVLFKPKRIVSPILMQMVTAGFLGFILAYPLIMYPTSLALGVPDRNQTAPATPQEVTQHLQTRLNEAVRNIATNIIFISGGLIAVGFVQHEIVRRVVGINGSRQDIDTKTYSFNASYDRMCQILLAPDVLNSHEFIPITKHASGIVILKSANRNTEKFILAIIPDPANKERKSILATVAYEVKFDTTFKSPEASLIRDQFIAWLKDEVPIKPADELTEAEPAYYRLPDSTSDLATITVIAKALQSTQPLTKVGEIPRYQVYVLIATIIIGGIMTVGWLIGAIPPELYGSSLILITIELMFIFIPAVMEEKRKRESQSFQDGS